MSWEIKNGPSCKSGFTAGRHTVIIGDHKIHFKEFLEIIDEYIERNEATEIKEWLKTFNYRLKRHAFYPDYDISVKDPWLHCESVTFVQADMVKYGICCSLPVELTQG